MRHFIVLGFKTTASSEEGKQIHLGSDRAKALKAVEAADGGFARKQLYELAIPHKTRHFSKPTETATKAKKTKKTD